MKSILANNYCSTEKIFPFQLDFSLTRKLHDWTSDWTSRLKSKYNWTGFNHSSFMLTSLRSQSYYYVDCELIWQKCKCLQHITLLMFFPLSLSHSGTTLTGQGTTSWAWPGSPKTSWLRSLASSCPTWKLVGSSHHQHPLPTHHQDSPSKPRYNQQRRGRIWSQEFAELTCKILPFS